MFRFFSGIPPLPSGGKFGDQGFAPRLDFHQNTSFFKGLSGISENQKMDSGAGSFFERMLAFFSDFVSIISRSKRGKGKITELFDLLKWDQYMQKFLFVSCGN